MNRPCPLGALAERLAQLEAVAQDVAAARREFGLVPRPVPESEGVA